MPYDADIPGRGRNATSFRDRFPELGYRQLRIDDRTFQLSCVGLGPSAAPGTQDPEVLLAALRQGCNVFDTAPWIGDRTHERVVGKAIAGAVEAGLCSRNDIWLSTSVGLVPELIEHSAPRVGFGRTMAVVEERFIRNGVFRFADLARSHHCLAPTYINYSVEQSLKALGVETIDCLFIEGLSAHRRHTSPAEFERRARRAAEAGEELVRSGRLAAYGVSLGEPTDLRRLFEIMFPHGVSSSLRAVRMPLSLMKHEHRSSLEYASSLGLHTFATGVLDGGYPRYELPTELTDVLGDVTDQEAAIAWVQGAPFVGTALFGTRDQRHLRANLRAARPRLMPEQLYSDDPEAKR